MNTNKNFSFLNIISSSPILLALFSLALLFLIFAKNLYIPPAIAGLLWGVQNKKIIGFKNFLQFFSAYFIPLIIFATAISFISFLLSGHYSEFTYGIKYIVLLSTLQCVLIFFATNIAVYLIYKFFTKNNYLSVIPKSLEYLINNPLKLLLLIFLILGGVFLAKDIYQTNTMINNEFKTIQYSTHLSTISALPYKNDKIIRFSHNGSFVNFELIDLISKKILEDRVLDLETVDLELYTAFIDKNKILLIAPKRNAGYKNDRNDPKFLNAGILDMNNYGFTKINKDFDFDRNRFFGFASAGSNRAVLASGNKVYLFETQYGTYKNFDKIMDLKETHYGKPSLIKTGKNEFIITSCKHNDDTGQTFINIELFDIVNKSSKIVYSKETTKINQDAFQKDFAIYKYKDGFCILIDDNNEKDTPIRYLILLDKNYNEIETRALNLGKFFRAENIVQLEDGNFLIFNSWIKPAKDPDRIYIYNIEENKFYPVKKKLSSKAAQDFKALLLNDHSVLIFNREFNNKREQIQLLRIKKH